MNQRNRMRVQAVTKTHFEHIPSQRKGVEKKWVFVTKKQDK
jgi:hypothetical protein